MTLVPDTISRQLAARIRALHSAEIPDEAAAIARLGFTDCIAVMLAGAPGQISTLTPQLITPGHPEARLVTTGAHAHIASAVLVNTMAAHILDYDDVALCGHPSAVLVPLTIALGEVTGASGEAVLRAYLAGYESWGALLAISGTGVHLLGWHPSAIFGPVAAAAAASLLLGLDETATAAALAIAASCSAGLVANFGTLTKSYQVGRAAQAGLQAAYLAKAGGTGAAAVFEHPLGFFAAIARKTGLDTDTPKITGFGTQDRWHCIEQGLNIKRYPVCYCSHRAIDAIETLVAEHALGPADIAAIDVEIGAMQASVLANHAPATGLAAKFSVEFAMAAYLVAGQVGMGELTDDFVSRPDIRRLMAATYVTELPDGNNDLGFADFDRVSVTTRDGATLRSAEIAFARGSAQTPLSPDQLRRKFDDCLHHSSRSNDSAHIFGAVGAIDRLPKISQIWA